MASLVRLVGLASEASKFPGKRPYVKKGIVVGDEVTSL